MKNHRNRMFFGVMALATSLALVSCGDFFSTTWGEDFARNPSGVKVSESNVKDLLRDANGDTKASRAILEKLRGTKNPALQAAAVKAANQASGLTQLVLSNLDTLTEDTNDTKALEKLGQTVLDEAKKNDIKGVAEDIAKTLLVDSSSSKPVFEGSFVKSVPTSDLTILLVTMMMAEAVDANDDFEEYVEGWGSEKKIDGTTQLDANERVIAAIANEVMTRPDSDLGKMLKDLVGYGN